MKGLLFDTYEVGLHPKTELLGGSWQGGKKDGKLLAWDQPLLRFFYDRMLEIDEPRILDIGAGTGSFCLLARFHPRALVVAFEPAREAFGILECNIAANDLHNQVSPYCLALSNIDGLSTLKVPDDPAHAGLATIGKVSRFEGYSEQKVISVAMDSLDLGRVDMLKIDVEGAELLVLQGGERTIREYRPGILLEYRDQTQDFGYNKQEIVDLLMRWGYSKFVAVGKEDKWIT